MKQITGFQVFVAYSWDSESHKENVKSFVQALRLNGINVIYDEELPYGKRIPRFMEKSISQSDIVLFVCTPDYKYRADNNISGVGYESEIITSEIYETSNEEKFIPILFTGTWKTSLPTWAKGKKGVDLSTPELYQVNFPKLISHLQNGGANPGHIESVLQDREAEPTAIGIRLDVFSSDNKVAKIWKKISDVTTFRGLVLVAVISGIVLLFISPLLSTLIPNPNPDNVIPNNSLFGSTNPSAGFDNSISGDNSLDVAASDNSLPSNTTQNDGVYDDRLEYLTANLDDSTLNGTMPKGTNPIIADITEETQEQLAFVQNLTIGCSKKWVDNTLGPPFAEKTMSIKGDRLMRPIDDENSKTGEILACVYRISDIVMVQACFDIPDNSCQAFFVTLLADVSDVDITMPTVYSPLVSYKPLGEFTFAEIGSGLASTYGFTGQGVAHTFYGEEYYFAGAGNFHDFYFAVLEHGMLDSFSDFVQFLSIIQFFIGPRGDTLPLPDIINRQREKFYPNTYGISDLDIDLTFDFLCDYYWYDNLMFRDVT